MALARWAYADAARAGSRVAAGGYLIDFWGGDLAAVVYGALAGKVETIFGDSVCALEDNGARVSVSFESGRPARAFDLVVGADGLHSRVRRLVFGPEESFEKYLGFEIAAFDLDGYRPREELVARLYTEVGFQVTAFSMRNDTTLFALTFLDDVGDVPRTRAKQEVEAYVLAAELARAPSHVAAFASYERKLGSFVRSKQEAAERLALAFAPKNDLQLFMRNSAMRLAGLPFVAKLVAGKSFNDRIQLPPVPTA